MYVTGSIPLFFVLKLPVNLAQALEGGFVCLSFRGICGTVYKWAISPFLLLKVGRLQLELELSSRLINFEVLRSWVGWLFVGFELTDKINNSCLFVQLCNKGTISVSLLTLIPDNANSNPTFLYLPPHGRKLSVHFRWVISDCIVLRRRRKEVCGQTWSCHQRSSKCYVWHTSLCRSLERHWWKHEDISPHPPLGRGETAGLKPWLNLLPEHCFLPFLLQEEGQLDFANKHPALRIYLFCAARLCSTRKINSRLQNLPGLGKEGLIANVLRWAAGALCLWCSCSSLFCLFSWICVHRRAPLCYFQYESQQQCRTHKDWKSLPALLSPHYHQLSFLAVVTQMRGRYIVLAKKDMEKKERHLVLFMNLI